MNNEPQDDQLTNSITPKIAVVTVEEYLKLGKPKPIVTTFLYNPADAVHESEQLRSDVVKNAEKYMRCFLKVGSPYYLDKNTCGGRLPKNSLQRFPSDLVPEIMGKGINYLDFRYGNIHMEGSFYVKKDGSYSSMGESQYTDWYTSWDEKPSIAAKIREFFSSISLSSSSSSSRAGL